MEYVVNKRGERTKVILTIEEYERLIEASEDAEDLLYHERVMAGIRSGEPAPRNCARRYWPPLSPGRQSLPKRMSTGRGTC